MKIISAILYVSDLLFPLWLFLIMRYLMKRDFKAWQAWGIASSFCVAQAYLVSKLIGWNLGFYLLGIIAVLPSLLSGQSSQPIFGNDIWILPPLMLIAMPTLILFIIGKYQVKNKKLSKEVNENA